MKIIKTGAYLPPFVADNRLYETLVDTNDEWIKTRSGISQRRLATQESVAEMASAAARGALEGIDPASVDLIISTSITPDYLTPSLSCLVALELGVSGAVCLDINAACAGFSYALDLANRYFATEPSWNRALVVSAEQLSKITDYTDRSTCVLFGDGAGAVLLERSAARFSSVLGSEPQLDNLYCKGIVNRNPWFEASESEEKTYPHGIYMNGKEVYKFATRVLPLALGGACAKLGITTEQLGLIIPHQANARILETAAKAMGVPLEKFMVNIDRYGNTSSASCAIALDEADRSGRLPASGFIGFVGFGGGLAYGSVVLEL